ncbi:MAG TPA: tRNA (adenosine(37)-N6)-threonylcarbamoyltransferase complex dimerization subunit type 1 TsaB [Pyrinomonadaceae bacterium]|nr:tRNA (adenosine(37)-N6)-threonylcarbamoyltransferase complex dimerization subunit type 1 TsaB [Pyrinomonadaceae bacterium]
MATGARCIEEPGMSLLLAIESSSNVYRVVLGRDGESIFDSAVNDCDQSLRTLSALLECGLESIGATASEIKGVAINVGPGSLTFVRAGISFVNALAFSLNVNIYSFNWFEIIAEQTRETTELPVVCAVPASNDNAYVGLIRGESVEIMRFGRVSEALAKVSDGLGDVAVAGRIRHRLAALLGEARVVDTGIENPDARTLLQLASRNGARSTRQVEALNDQSDVFFE